MKAVIFDMDGLLVDSEPIHFKTSVRLFGKYGKRFTKANAKEFLGVRVFEEMKILKRRWRLEPSPEALLTERKTIFRELVETELQLSKGAKELLEYLSKERILVGLGTSAESWYVVAVVKKFNLGRYFGAIVDGEQVKRGKPDPEVYVKVAEKLGIKPSECLVLEDAPVGVMAAKGAGMRCWAVPGAFTNIRSCNEADEIFKSLVEGRQALEK